MCMIVCALTKDFGVIAADSARYQDGKTYFDTPKMFHTGNYLYTLVGTPAYFMNLDFEVFKRNDMTDVMAELSKHFLGVREKVVDSFKSLEDEEDRKANFCMFLMGSRNGVPTLCQLNSFEDFKSNVLFADDDPLVFSDIYYGDTIKNQILTNSHNHMKILGDMYETVSPGIVGEILTRGIYFKADEEMKYSKKYAGGPVTVVAMDKTGKVTPLTNLNI